MIKLLCLIALLPTLAWCSYSTENFFYFRAGKRIEVPVGELENIKVNDSCLHGQKKCLALKRLHQKSKIKQLKNVIPGNASGSYCDLLGGVQLFMERETDKQRSQFCVFNDLSMIDAKELYLRHYGEK